MKWRGTILIGSFLAVIIDRACKVLIEQPSFAYQHIGWQFFAFERFHNSGVAFDIPIAPAAAIPITLIFLLLLWFWARGEQRIWLVPIFLGALSNLFDRAIFQITIDYIRILYSIINIADLLVLGGMVGLLISKKET